MKFYADAIKFVMVLSLIGTSLIFMCGKVEWNVQFSFFLF